MELKLPLSPLWLYFSPSHPRGNHDWFGCFPFLGMLWRHHTPLCCGSSLFYWSVTVLLASYGNLLFLFNIIFMSFSHVKICISPHFHCCIKSMQYIVMYLSILISMDLLSSQIFIQFLRTHEVVSLKDVSKRNSRAVDETPFQRHQMCRGVPGRGSSLHSCQAWGSDPASHPCPYLAEVFIIISLMSVDMVTQEVWVCISLITSIFS